MNEDRALLSFLSKLQLKCGKDHVRSDLVLNALEQFRNNEISREHCIKLIMNLLRPFPKLAAQFGRIVEEVPKPQTRVGSISSDPYINTVVEFELWPNAIKNILSKARKALLDQCTLEDLFVDIENINNTTSGPFWLLWDLYHPILPSCWFIQAIYDGTVENDAIPDHLKLETDPLKSDKDPVSLTHNTIIDSDLVCCYTSDCRFTPLPIGLLRHGSYGLLGRSKVNAQCSGRKLLDYSVTNDRWATAASGSERCFNPSPKNQFEEKLFIMEDERITTDVRISRMKSTNLRIKKLIESVLHNNFFDPETFPKGVLTSLDVLTLKELYGKDLSMLYKNIIQNPVEMLSIINSRIEEKISMFEEIRNNKEREYYEINKRNYPKSLEVRNVEKVTTSQTTKEFTNFDEIKEILHFPKRSIEFTIDILFKTFKLTNNKETTFISIINMLLILFGLKGPEKASIKVNPVFPSLHESKYYTNQTFIISIDIAIILQMFEKILTTINEFLLNEPSQQQTSYDTINNTRGLNLAIAIGHVSQNALHSSIDEESLKEMLPQYVVSNKHNAELESLFDNQSDSVQQTLEGLKRNINNFIKNSINLLLDDFNNSLIEALDLYNKNEYMAETLTIVSGNNYYTALINESENEEFVEMKLIKETPRITKIKNSYTVLSQHEIGPMLVSNLVLNEQQDKMLRTIYLKNKRSVPKRNGFRTLEFRLSKNGIEFRGPGINVMKASDV
ncbi:paired amphipathic helix containing protein [Histomonas meleagridis]|uniref:paired amphipathic helix containing protein n=1 Tax=Histomonas meleagridis TaxID=135588 RepID=UPI00355A9257|nr:paired amphipathic helix containing protein [Histomonas meleagridis]KAH0798232.1 paired amphipathic helix containing protein [Histomonas meleagridis]